ncbi:MAG: hypothetical protein LBE76_08205 [Nitrososphaerota archaeon]|nr:hypothetical protein [Nitrososphaerota archaeon]
MLNVCKKFALLLVFTLVSSSLFLVGPCIAPVTMPTNPSSAPEVSVEIHNNPIWHPPTYTTNPYTDETTQTHPGGYSTNGSIILTIKNRPFTSYNDADHHYNIYYLIFTKMINTPWKDDIVPRLAVYQSDLDNTVITFTYNDKEGGISISLLY